MKYLGIDYGSKHTGLATSDTGGNVAMPYSIVANNKDMKQHIVEVVRSEHIEGIVIGESKDFQGKDNVIQRDINEFTIFLEQTTGLTVHRTSELFSSKMAKQGTEHILRFNPRNTDKRALHKKERRIDDKAATIMLQSYLDSQAT